MRWFWRVLTCAAIVAASLAITVLVRMDLLKEGNEPIPKQIPSASEEATIDWVYDGDTIEVLLHGSTDTVRLAGIDAPETGGNHTPIECFSAESTEFLRRLLPAGSTVWLEKDRTQRDRYGRLIRFVWVSPDDGSTLLVNGEMVRHGYARASVYRPDLKYSEVLAEREESARDEGLGLWVGCSVATHYSSAHVRTGRLPTSFCRLPSGSS